MDVKIPKGMKSPTVIIVGQETDDKKNDLTLKRMDNLERNLDRQYRAFTDNKEYIKVIERLQKSFMDKLEKIILSTNSNKGMYEKRIENLRKEFNSRVSSIKPSDNSSILRTFSRKLSSLENAIKSQPVSKEVKVVRQNSNLDKAFERMFSRLENAILKSRPKLTPMPM